MIRPTPIFAAALAFACLAWTLEPLQAQTSKKKTDPIKGTVVSIEKAKIGKSYTLTMKAEDDTEYEVPIVPRTLVKIVAKGDAGFVKSGTIIYSKIYEFEGPADFTAQDLTICIGVPMQPHITTISQKEDEPDTEIVGKIEGLKRKGTDEYPDIYNVNCGTRTITLECETKDVEITLNLADPSFIKEGDTVEADGPVIASRKQIKANSITVTSAEPITSEDYFAALADAKKSKTAKSSVSKSKSKTDTKSDDDPEPADKDAKAKNSPSKSGVSDASDPFGVLKGKKSTKPKTEKSETPSDAKKEDAKGSDKKSE